MSTLERGLALLEALRSSGFGGRTRDDLSAATGIPAQTAWRLLKTLEQAGWVEELAPTKTGQALFRLASKKLVETAFAYKRHMLSQRQALDRTYFETTGETLND